jgi:hypothetical protein
MKRIVLVCVLLVIWLWGWLLQVGVLVWSSASKSHLGTETRACHYLVGVTLETREYLRPQYRRCPLLDQLMIQRSAALASSRPAPAPRVSFASQPMEIGL